MISAAYSRLLSACAAGSEPSSTRGTVSTQIHSELWLLPDCSAMSQPVYCASHPSGQKCEAGKVTAAWAADRHTAQGTSPLSTPWSVNTGSAPEERYSVRYRWAVAAVVDSGSRRAGACTAGMHSWLTPEPWWV